MQSISLILLFRTFMHVVVWPELAGEASNGNRISEARLRAKNSPFILLSDRVNADD